MPEATSSARTVLTVATLLLLASIGLWAVLSREPISKPGMAVQGDSSPVDGTGPAPRLVADKSQQASGASGHADLGSQQQPAVEPPQSSEPWKLRFLDADSLPVGGLEVSLCVESTATFQMRVSDDALQPSPVEWKVAGTDRDGWTTVPVPADGGQPCSLRVRLNTRGWMIVTRSSHPNRLPEGEFGFMLSDREPILTLRVKRNYRVACSFRFEDGLPLEGDMYARITIAPRESFTVERDVHQGGPVEFDVPANVAELEIGVHSQRRGFQASHQVRLNGIQIESVMEIVVPADPKQCWLDVDLSQWPSGTQVAIALCADDWTPVATDVALGGGLWSSPYARHYSWQCVEAKTGDCVWVSEPLVFAPGESKRVVAPYQKAVSYSLRVVDPDSKPVRGARVSFKNEGWFHWAQWRQTLRLLDTEQRAGVCTDANGTVTVKGWPSSVAVMFVDALGFEHRVLSLNPRPGEAVDMGTVTLEPARGAVTIVLKGQRQGLEYAFFFYGRAPLVNLEFLRGTPLAEIKLEAIPLRKYMVRVQAGSGGEGVNIDVELTSSNPSQTIEVDVSAFKTADERRSASGG